VKRLLVLLAGLALVAGLQAQTGIAGTVTDARTRQPLPGVAVCTGQGGAYTDSTGHYLIQIQPGTYQLHASKTGYVTAVYPESIVVIHGQVTQPVDFALEPVGNQNGGIGGRVTDAATGDAIAGALIIANGPNGHGETYSYACGGYQIAELPQGKYRVCASAAGYQSQMYPESVLVVAGQVTTGVNFALVASGGGTGSIAGFVSNAGNGEPIAGALLTAVGPNGSGEAHTCRMGGYQITGLPAGRYRVHCRAQGFESQVYPESVTVIAGQNTPGINFALVPEHGELGGISGNVSNSQSGEPVFGALVVAEGPGRGQANTCMRGNYFIGELPAGTYLVVASARGFVTSQPETVEVQAGQVVQGVDFALVPEAGEPGGISGAVTDSATGLPIAGANVFAWGPSGQGLVQTDSTGLYLISGLRAGKYLVRACARGYYHRLYAESVHVQPGQTTERICFALTPCLGAGISGFVYDGVDQTEVAGALVSATGPGGTEQTFTNSLGEYLLDGLAPDEYIVTVTAPGYNQGSYFEPVLVQAGVIAGLVSPPIYRLTGVEESPAPLQADRLSVEPSPFSGHATIRWQVSSTELTNLRVFDKSGRAVQTLSASRPASGSVVWDGSGESGQKLARGTYFIELRTPSRRLVARALLVN
jgi:hypothetical protein